MKRATRETLVQVERMNDSTLRADQARDLLKSDTRQRAEIRRLRAGIRAIQRLTGDDGWRLHGGYTDEELATALEDLLGGEP